ncbi:MAG: TIR domain-containing protein [Candidatus Latescibacteria bacterium]|jgi:hypothetical protein|nr:TIR domain-containing protein [Candidatus Latescibacterota bacterium]
MEICPVCLIRHKEVTVIPYDYRNYYIINCPRCGKYRISGSKYDLFTKDSENISELDRAKYSYLIKQNQKTENNEVFNINNINIDEYKLPGIEEQSDNLIRWIGKNIDTLDGHKQIESLLLTSEIGAKNINGVNYLVKFLQENNEIDSIDITQQLSINEKDDGFILSKTDILSLGLKPKGWVRFEKLKKCRSMEMKSFKNAKPNDEDYCYEYDVAISFAGTEREYAEQLATLIEDKGYKVFYDKFFEGKLWGEDLIEYFHEIYGKNSRYCVIFVSEEYNKRMWTNHERKSAQERALKERGKTYILPIKVDDSELPGMPSTIKYLLLSDHSIEDIAIILLEKLKTSI